MRLPLFLFPRIGGKEVSTERTELVVLCRVAGTTVKGGLHLSNFCTMMSGRILTRLCTNDENIRRRLVVRLQFQKKKKRRTVVRTNGIPGSENTIDR